MTILPGTEVRTATPWAGRGADLGAESGILLAGPAAVNGPEALGDHRTRFGAPAGHSADEVLTEIRASGLRGRGGGGFPLWRKLETAREADVRSGVEPLVVVNCSESEPASRKDWTLCSFRPHTVLDGAALIAKGLSARHVVIHVHHDAARPRTALRRALEERDPEGDPRWRLSLGPGGYVAGEASAVARFLDSGVALPSFSTVPLAHRGPNGRPTVVTNAETAAQVAAIMSTGAARWRATGSGSSPGPHLVTLAGAVALPGQVLELVGRATIGDLLAQAGLAAPPRAVLVGGYAGTWVRGEVAWSVPMEAESLREVNASFGCGLLGVQPHGTCVLAETARLARYLAGESAGQCGPCVHGLPTLAASIEALADGHDARRALRRLRRCIEELPGSGACSHPDGVVRLVASALDVFGDDLARHRRGRPCASAGRDGVFPIPSRAGAR